MRIQIINRSTDPAVAMALPVILKAALIGVDGVASAWDLPPPQIAYDPLVVQPPAGWAGIFVRDKPGAGEEGVQGYHDVAGGLPVGYVFDGFVPDGQKLHDPTGRGASLAGIFTHELVEMLADGCAQDYRRAPFRDPHTGAALPWVALELCDPVQEVALQVVADGVTVDFSDWITPGWFSSAPAGPYDASGALAAPLELAPGGYVIAAPDGGEEQEIFGRVQVVEHQQPQAEWRAQMKRVNALSRTRRRQS